jgi:hypothetical protein
MERLCELTCTLPGRSLFMSNVNGKEPAMRKAIILGIAGVFISSAAMACGWGKTVTNTTQQTVMTDQGTSGGSTTSTVKTEPKG